MDKLVDKRPPLLYCQNCHTTTADVAWSCKSCGGLNIFIRPEDSKAPRVSKRYKKKDLQTPLLPLAFGDGHTMKKGWKQHFKKRRPKTKKTNE